MGNPRIAISISNADLRIVDGQVIIIQKCPKCSKKKDINDFGVRKMGGGEIRRQSYCRVCRNKKN